MMKFSSKSEYGLKAMANLATFFPLKKTLKEISKEENISLKYLERLMGILRRRKIILSQKGKGGGYVLSRKPSAISVGEIIEALEGPLTPMKCMACGIRKNCSSAFVWEKLEKEIRKTLAEIKLSEISEKNIYAQKKNLS